MTYQNLNNSSYKLRCQEEEVEPNTLLLFMCAMKNQVLVGHVTTRRISSVHLTNYVVDLTIPLGFCYVGILHVYLT